MLKSSSSNWKKIFFTVWSGQVFSIFGSNLVQFALVWWLTQKTGSATVLTTATLVAILPEVLLGPFAGALIDRWDRRLTMIVADGTIALISAGLAVLYWLGIVEVWHIYVVIFLRALGGVFHFPAMQASISLLVPDDQLARVAGLNQTLRGAISIVAPPAGAFLLGIAPFYAVIAIDVVTAALAIIPLLIVSIPRPERSLGTEITTPKIILRDVREGLHYVVAWPGLLIFLAMATLINLLINPASTLMPLLVTNHFKGGAWEIGWLESAAGIGIVIGGLVLSVWGGFRRRVYTSLMGIIGLGVGILITGMAPANMFYLALAGLFFVGVMNPMCNGPLQALVQSKVAPEVQGRVFTLISSACSAMMPLGMIIAGPLAEVWGVRAWFYIGGIATILIGVSGFFIKRVVHIEDYTEKELAPVEKVPELSKTPAA